MRIDEYPRPKDDNGRGLHWSARIYHPTGADLDYWIDQLQAMQIKWLKLLDDGGGSSLELCRRLLAADIMPIVRLYRGEPNPDAIGGREVDTIKRLVDIGVRYFETNNEPDLPAEWRIPMPPNWLEIVVDNFIHDADLVLGAGGLLALPAMGPGSKDNPIAMIVNKGRRDLFERGCWVAIHNYTLNHPLDYPDDDVNQLGVPLTREEYNRFGAWAWDHRPLEMINQLRAERKNPGATVYDDPNCFRGYLWTARMIEEALGFMVPIISTEGGPVVGWGDDKRYPKVTPEQQKEWQLGITRFFEEEAPPYYFTCCTWLIAAQRLGDFNPTWEQMAWYGHAWDARFGLHGELPIVQALKDLPARSRLAPLGTATVAGRVLRQDTGQALGQVSVSLRSADVPSRVRQTTTDAAGGFRFEQVAAGAYTLAAGPDGGARTITVAEGAALTVDLSLPVGSFSSLSGRVVDTRGAALGNAPVRLFTVLGELVAATHTDREGRYRLDNLPAGVFVLEAAEGDQRARIDGVALDGFAALTVNVTVPAPPGYLYAVTTKRLLSREETQGRSLFFGRVFDAAGNGLNGITLEMRWTGAAPGTQFPRTRTGHDPFKPAGTYEFVHTRGEFMIEVVQGDWPSEVAEGLRTAGIPGREQEAITWEVNFQLRPFSIAQTSVIRGQAVGGEGARVFLNERRSGQRWTTTIAADGSFRFVDLGRGTYALEIEGIGVIREGINLDGQNEVEVIFPQRGIIQGLVRGLPAGSTAVARLHPLVPGWAWTREAPVSAQGTYRFHNLPAAPYEIEIVRAGQPHPIVPVVCDGLNLFTAPPIDLGSPDQLTLEGQVRDLNGAPAPGVRVELWRAGQMLNQTTTDDHGRFRFDGLPPGEYELRAPSLQITRTDIMLIGPSGLQVILAPEGAVMAKVLTRYVLFGLPDQPLTRIALLLVQPYLAATRAAAGFSFEEARRAEQVIIVGNEDAVSADAEHALREAGCVVRRLAGDLYAIEQGLRESA